MLSPAGIIGPAPMGVARVVFALMGRRNRRDTGRGPSTEWESERTLAAAEEEAGRTSPDGPIEADVVCLCGNHELLLEAYLRVVDGQPDPTPVEVGTLTCPKCGREFDAVDLGDGRIVRGDFLGTAELEDD